MNIQRCFIALIVVVFWLGACAAPPAQEAQDKIDVVATTTIVGDVVGQVGGDAIDFSVLLPVGVDPHSFTPTPQDVAKVSQADIVFANGAGLEEFLAALLESAGAMGKTFSVSEGIQLLELKVEHAHEGEGGHAEEHGHEGEASHTEEHTHEGEHAHNHAGIDPHVWFDPTLVKVWVQNIAAILSEKDAANTTLYQKNAQQYIVQLEELDQWIRQQVQLIPPENRLLVVDHSALGYFAARYGFTQVGAVLPSFSTLAEPSAQELASLEDAIRQQGVKAIFVGTTVNPQLAQRIADDTGVRLVYLYTGSLSEKGGEADTYINFMRYNVNAMVEALK